MTPVRDIPDDVRGLLQENFKKSEEPKGIYE